MEALSLVCWQLVMGEVWGGMGNTGPSWLNLTWVNGSLKLLYLSVSSPYITFLAYGECVL